MATEKQIINTKSNDPINYKQIAKFISQIHSSFEAKTDYNDFVLSPFGNDPEDMEVSAIFQRYIPKDERNILLIGNHSLRPLSLLHALTSSGSQGILLIIDPSQRVHKFWSDFILLMKSCQSREDCRERIIPNLLQQTFDAAKQMYLGLEQAGIIPSVALTQSRIKANIQNKFEKSFLRSELDYARLKILATQGVFLIQDRWENTELFKLIQSFCKTTKLHPVFYASNIIEYIEGVRQESADRILNNIELLQPMFSIHSFTSKMSRDGSSQMLLPDTFIIATDSNGYKVRQKIRMEEVPNPETLQLRTSLFNPSQFCHLHLVNELGVKCESYRINKKGMLYLSELSNVIGLRNSKKIITITSSKHETTATMQLGWLIQLDRKPLKELSENLGIEMNELEKLQEGSFELNRYKI